MSVTPNEQPLLLETNAQAVDQRLGSCNSYERTRELWLSMVITRSPRERISLYLDWANCCDAPWWYRGDFVEMLRDALRQVPLREVLPLEERAWFDAMGPSIQVFRGCEAGRVRGLSWTTDIQVARGFAAGKRCVNADPTIASALIPNEHVLALFLNRQENEVVVDPRRLRQLKVQPLEDKYRWAN
jgi:hypothetical protein